MAGKISAPQPPPESVINDGMSKRLACPELSGLPLVFIAKSQDKRREITMSDLFERTENQYYFGNLSQELAAANPDIDIKQINDSLVQEIWKDRIHTLGPDPRNRQSLIWTLHSSFDDDILRDLHPMPCLAPLDQRKVALAISRKIKVGGKIHLKQLVDQLLAAWSKSALYRKETLALLSEVPWQSYPPECRKMIEYFIFPAKKFPHFCEIHGLRNPIEPYVPSPSQLHRPATDNLSIPPTGPAVSENSPTEDQGITSPAPASEVTPTITDSSISVPRKTKGRRPFHIKTYMEKFLDRAAAGQVEERPIEEARWLREWLRRKLQAGGGIVREKDLPAEETIRNNLYAVWCFDTRQRKPMTAQIRRWLDTEQPDHSSQGSSPISSLK